MGSTGPELEATTTVYARTDSDRTALTLESRLRHYSARPQPARQRERQAAKGWVHHSCQIVDSAVLDDCSTWASRTHITFELPRTSSSRRLECVRELLHVTDPRRTRTSPPSSAPLPPPISHDAAFALEEGPGLVLGPLCLARFGHLEGGASHGITSLSLTWHSTPHTLARKPQTTDLPATREGSGPPKRSLVTRYVGVAARRTAPAGAS